MSTNKKPLRVYAFFQKISGVDQSLHLMVGENIREALQAIETESCLRFGHGWTANRDALERGNRSFLDAKGKRVVDAALAEARADGGGA